MTKSKSGSIVMWPKFYTSYYVPRSLKGQVIQSMYNNVWLKFRVSVPHTILVTEGRKECRN